MGKTVESLGERVRRLRKARGWAQADLGDKIGLRQLAVSQIETGKTSSPRSETLAALADALDTSVDYLLNGSEPSLDTSTSQLDDTMTSHDRAIVAVGPLEPELEAHLRKRLQEWAFLDGGTMTALVGALESEKSRWRAQQSGMPPKVRDAPALDVEPVEGGMFIAAAKKKKR